jgi:peroxiredoxin
MQKIVNKYKEDESVAFYFIDTFEDGEDRLEKVSKFVRDNNYSFDVLIDPTKENGRDHLVAKNYNISGIPTKIIIGPNGKVRFKSVGYSGSAEKTVNEIDAMVELLRTTP